MRYREDDRGIMTNRERVAYDRWLTTPPDDELWYCQDCGGEYELDIDPGDFESDLCPKCRGETYENAKVGKLVQRLVEAGKLTIDADYLSLNPEKWGYYVSWADGEAEVKLVKDNLLEALERVDENVSLLSCS